MIKEKFWQFIDDWGRAIALLLLCVIVLILLWIAVPPSSADMNSHASIYNSPYQPESWTVNTSNISPQFGTAIYVARGESVEIPFNHPYGTCWYFQTSGPNYEPRFYDYPAIITNNTTVCDLSSSMSGAMQIGEYDVLYTYPSSINGKLLKDATWKNGSIDSIFGTNQPLDESGKIPLDIMQDLQILIKKDNVDGTETSNLYIQNPELYISRLEQTGLDVITVSGTTNLKDGDIIKFTVDNGAHDTQKDAANFTYFTTVKRSNVVDEGVFKTDMNMPLQSMAEGWHELTATSDGLTSTIRFQVSESWNPSPTPVQYMNYFSNGSIKPDVLYFNTTITVIQTQMVDVWHTATPTPSITDAFGGTIGYPYEPGKSLPEGVALVCMVGMAAIVLNRDYKRKP